MSDIEIIREALPREHGYASRPHVRKAYVALDRLAAHMQAQDARIRTLDELEETLGEVEADAAFLDNYLRAQGEWIKRVKEWQSHAEKAERALAEAQEAVERALPYMEAAAEKFGGHVATEEDLALARAALRPSEEAGDENWVEPDSGEIEADHQEQEEMASADEADWAASDES